MSWGALDGKNFAYPQRMTIRLERKTAISVKAIFEDGAPRPVGAVPLCSRERVTLAIASHDGGLDQAGLAQAG